jgi:hypothetical protein
MLTFHYLVACWTAYDFAVGRVFVVGNTGFLVP